MGQSKSAPIPAEPVLAEPVPTCPQEPPTYKVIFLGDVGVGKTTLHDLISRNAREADRGTIFSTYSLLRLGEECSLEFWDTAGQELYGILMSDYHQKTHICISVFDVTNLKSFERVKYWLDEFKKDNSRWKREVIEC